MQSRNAIHEGMNEMSKSNAKTNNATSNALIPLKSLHNDIVRDNPDFTRTTKQMRVVLREKFADIHERNASWSFTPSQYDRVRAHFDPKYAARIERANKRNAKTRTPRKSRVIADNANATSAAVVNNELHDA